MSWIWKDQSFMEQCCNDFFSFNLGSIIPVSLLSPSSNLNNAANFIIRILNKTLEKSGSLISPDAYKSLLKAKEVISTTDSILWQHLQDALSSAASGNYSLIYGFIFSMINRIRDLQDDEWIFIPGGVILSEDTPIEWLSYAIYKSPASSNYSFAVINTGGLGLKYHSFRMDKYVKLGTLQRDATLVLKGVKSERLLHSSFWFILYRLMYAPSIHNYEILYSVLLPFLNSKSVLLNWHIDVEQPTKSTQPIMETDDSTKKLLIEAFTQLHETHESKQVRPDSTRTLAIELSNNLGGIWMDSPLNVYKPGTILQALLVFIELIMRQDGNSESDVRTVSIIFQLSLCLLIGQQLDGLSPKDGMVHINHRSASLFIELACKRLSIMAAEELLQETQKETLIDFDTEDSLSITAASEMSQIVGSINSAFPSVAKVAGSLGQERDRLTYDPSAPLQRRADLYNLVSLVVGKIYCKLQGVMPPHSLGMGKGSCTMDKRLCSPDVPYKLNLEFDNFGKFRLDGPNVNELAKGSVKSQLLLPVELTSIDIPITSFSDVCKVLRKCVEVCAVLSNQRDAMLYTYAWRFQLIKHVLLELIPLPLPIPKEIVPDETVMPVDSVDDGAQEPAQDASEIPCTHPEPMVCFWANGEIERETQIDLLRLLQMLAKNVAAISCSLLRTRGLEGEKAVMLAVIAAITDAVLRKIAVDTPSPVSMLYSGKAEGPVTAFGFSLGNFSTESSYYSLTNPLAVIARNQVLDYFKSIQNIVDANHTVFSWEHGMEIGPGDELLVHLISLQLGFNRNIEDIRKYYVGENSEFCAIFPEFGYIRDVVLIAKAIGWSGSIGSPSRYSLEDATLKWSLSSITGYKHSVSVKAFGKQLKVAGIGKVKNFDDTNVTYYKRMFRWFGGSQPKSPNSAADPHNLAADCEIENETDVLHLSQFPDYGGKIGRRDSELLLQYLTASYVRIPLVTQFFSDEANLHAVSSPELQKVIIASIFEPGTWQSATLGGIKPQTAPVQSRECLSTPLGLLFNEIYHSGSCVLSSIEQMLDLALERDHNIYTGDSSKVLLFSVRLAVHVCDYVLQAIKHYRYVHSEHIFEPIEDPICKKCQSTIAIDGKRVSKTGWKSAVNGLLLQSEEMCKDLEGFERKMRVLLLEAAKLLSKRAIKAEKDNEHNAAATSMAHVALVYRYIMDSVKDDNSQEYSKTCLYLASAIFFVFVHHQFSVEQPLEVASADGQLEDELDMDEPLCMPEMELFGIMQSVRSNLLKHFRLQGRKECSGMLEILVKRVSQLANADKLDTIEDDVNDFWEELQTPIASGRFTRSSMAQRQLMANPVMQQQVDESDLEDVLLESFYVDDELEGQEQANWGFDAQVNTGIAPGSDDEAKPQSKAEHKGLIKQTKSMVVGQTKKTFDKSKALGKRVYRKMKRKKQAEHGVSPIEAYEGWLKLKVMQHCDIEINFQTAEFSLKKNRLQLLGHWVNQFPHFVDIMGKITNKATIQSATVQLHKNRHWLRLTGRNYDLVRWEKDDREYMLPQKSTYRNGDAPKGLEWLATVLDPWVSQYMPKWTLYLYKDKLQDLEVTRTNDPFENVENEVHIPYARLFAQCQQSSCGVSVDVPVANFDACEHSSMQDFTNTYVPHEQDGLVKFAKNATETISNIHNVITDAAATISKISSKSKSAVKSTLEAANITDKSSETPGSKRIITKEIFVTKNPPCIYVFDVIEIGRTWHRSLCYCSDVSLSFSNSLSRHVTMQSIQDKKPSLVAGTPIQPTAPHQTTLLIIRSIKSQQYGSDGNIQKEQFVQPECLRGLIPEVLLEEYSFWQNIKTSDIVGYPKTGTSEKYAKTHLWIELLPQGPPDNTLFQHSEAKASIRRVHQEDDKIQQLVNLQDPKDELLKSFTETLLRLDDLSHILPWSLESKENIDLIEFAKLGLTFKSSYTSSNALRYMCEEHNGLYLNYGNIWHSPLTAALIRGLENSLLLTDDDGELYILVSTVRKPMCVFPKAPSSCVVTQNILNMLQGVAWPELLYDGSNSEWLQAIDSGSRHYLYKVHSSRSFLFVPTSAAGLFLLLNRFLDRQYEQVCKLSKGALFDDDNLGTEEKVFWDILAKIDSTRDRHPDAYACRLHLLLAANRQGLHVADGIKIKHSRLAKIQKNLSNFKSMLSRAKTVSTEKTSFINWILHQELLAYITNIRYVSAGCKLSVEDERELLQLCQPRFSSFPILQNRFAILCAVKFGENTRTCTMGSKIEFSIPLKPSVSNYDEVIDKSVVEKNLILDAATNFTSLKFKRPEEQLTGANALQYIDKLLQRGVTQGDFILVYELLTGVFPIATFPNENSHGWGALLTRFICSRDPNTKNVMLSTMKLLSAEPKLGSSMPRCPDDVMKKKQFAAMFSRVQQPIHKFLSEIQKTVTSLQDRKRFEWNASGKSSQRLDYALRVDPSIQVGKSVVPWLFPRYQVNCGRGSWEIGPCKVGDVEISREFIEEMGSQLCKSVHPTEKMEPVVPISTTRAFPIDLKGHWIMKYDSAKRFMNRLETEFDHYLKEEAQRSTSSLGFTEQEIDSFVNNGDTEILAEGFRRLQSLRERLMDLFRSDGQFVESGIRSALQEANSISATGRNTTNDGFAAWGFIFGKLGGLEFLIGLDRLVDCLVSTEGEKSLQLLNPFVDRPHEILSLVAAVMLAVNRRIMVARCISQLLIVLQALKRLSKGTLDQESLVAIKAEIATSTRSLSEKLYVARHYMKLNGSTALFDPRLLLFEFSSNIILYKRQVELVENFVDSANSGTSRCHQMIMGEGKTTVVGPLLSLLLADGNRLFVQVCPYSLLEFTRATLRETFSAVIHKSVYTFKFSRFDKATPELYLKLLQAKQMGSIVIATPTSIKSLFLKVICSFHKLESGELKNDALSRVNQLQQKLVKVWNMTASGATKLIKQGTSKQPETASKETVHSTDTDQRNIQLELDICLRILELFSNAILLMDEIDLLLHPLKSELHWPIGEKKPLTHLPGTEFNIRWLLPWHILRVMLSNTSEQIDKGEETLLEKIRKCIDDGVKSCYMSDFPHLVLLSIPWYEGELKPLLAEWIYLFLRKNNLITETFQQCMDFFLDGKSSPVLQNVRVLNFARDWLSSIFPHCTSRVNQVNYGVLSLKQIEESMATNPNAPQTRKMLAVPFIGKGAPVRDSEFSHPDVLIGFTILAYKYQGLRVSDFVLAMRHLAQRFYEEPGRAEDRQSYKLFNRWVLSAGAKLRVSKRTTRHYHYLYDPNDSVRTHTENVDRESDVWTLDAINVYDDDQMAILYDILKNEGLAIEYYLCNVLFPAAMEHTEMQLTATAQELGSSILFPIRLGFSGTPSDLLPVEMGGCHYSPGTDGKILTILTDDRIMKGPMILPKGWNSETVLDAVAKSPLKPLALIDTGALITNFSNLQVAKELLSRGLEHVDGVVYLDDQDRQMILLRDRWRSTLLTHCGLPPERRFSFYDQIHSTGQDIKQAAHAMAFITIGIDMTFRDYSQGAWRMRGIGKGQTLHMIVPREVMALVSADVPEGLDEHDAQFGLSSSVACKLCARWLIARGIQSEIKLSRILLEQCLQNVVRKEGFQTLIEEHLNISGGSVQLRRYVQLFREYKDFSIPNTFAPKPTVTDRIRTFVKAFNITDDKLSVLLEASHASISLKDIHGNEPRVMRQKAMPAVQPVQAGEFGMTPEFMNSPVLGGNSKKYAELIDIFQTTDSDIESDDGTTCPDVNGNPISMDYLEMEENLEDNAFDLEAEHEQEIEVLQEEEEATQMREQTKEEEHATEEEAPVPHSYSRSEEDIVYWSLNQMAVDPSQIGFLPCKDFYLYRKDATKTMMPFPEYILISPNFYKIKWSTHSYRRLKNVIVVLDILPSQDTSPSTPPNEQVQRNTCEIPYNIVQQVGLGFEVLDNRPGLEATKGGSQVSLDTALRIVKAIDPEMSDDGNLISKCIASKLAEYKEVKRSSLIGHSDLISCMMNLYSVNNARKFIILTLAEAEAVRAWLHKHDNIHARISLRHLAARFQPFDYSADFAPTKEMKMTALVGLQPRVVNACLKFFNSEVQFTRGQISLLERCFKHVSGADRLTYFQQLREMRLVIQNIKVALASAPNISRIFRSQLVDDLTIRLLNLKLQCIIAEKGGPHGLLAALKSDKLTGVQLNAIINSNIHKPVAKPNDIKALFQNLDVDCDGMISLQDLEYSFDEIDDLTIQSCIQWIQISLIEHNDVKPVAKCPQFSVWTPKKLTHYLGVHVAILAHHFTEKKTNKGGVATTILKIAERNKSSVSSKTLAILLKSPVSFTKIWQNGKVPDLVIWKVNAPEGYTALGLVASKGEEPSIESISCVPIKWVDHIQPQDNADVQYEHITVKGFSPELEEMELNLTIYNGFAFIDEPIKLMYQKFALQADMLDPNNIPAPLSI
ncbi:conserved hypothetical protein [Theileria equi strain WA]|uniref:ubiquitinyl hydrolase 1 n=1 Tax=Theileria equi strain WA TaxID=1537102 RepID=L1LCT6_THEEQ|nr:conserved hypothetical protein [Theileria equi strain WA]EKX73094.1 conserved hypothetical protein [Theileria equi strain WA]|eukprot:XP_004832546.1 conserved hypothetical protein [Theileria equi strain WA]